MAQSVASLAAEPMTLTARLERAFRSRLLIATKVLATLSPFVRTCAPTVHRLPQSGGLEDGDSQLVAGWR
jgi:hypothetical protein